MGDVVIQTINPLPAALHHYERALLHTLRRAGVASVAPVELDIEASSGKSHTERAADLVRAYRRSRASGDLSLVLWPSFGYAELALMSLLRPQDAVIFHDARPLRQQFGMRAWQGRVVAPFTRSRWGNRVIVHSRLAGDALRELRWSAPTVLPHPVLPRPVSGGAGDVDQPVCLVLGQYKPSRSLELLAALPARLPGWRLRMVGRGWPHLSGWSVTPDFVSEERVQAELDAATVVLIPYAQFFQSGVMVRAAEHSKPVVSVRHEQTLDLYGAQWPGIVDAWDPASVAVTVERCADLATADIRGIAQKAEEVAVAAWGHHLRARLA